MFIRHVKKPNGHISIRIVENFRTLDGKIKQQTVFCAGHCHESDTKKIEYITEIAQTAMVKVQNATVPTLPGMEELIYRPRTKTKNKSEESISISTTVEEKRVNKGIHDIYGGIYSQLGFDSILNHKSNGEINKWAELLKQIVIARIAIPCSKKKTTEILEKDFNQEHKLHDVYRMMDKLNSKEESIKNLCQNSTLNLLDQKVDVLFFDVTTLDFESQVKDTLRDNGFSKDCKFKEVQVVIALVTTSEGLPIWFKEFKGNTWEGSTMITMVEEMKKSFQQIREIVFVADRAMFNKSNLDKLDELGVKYVVAAKLKSLKKEKKEELLNSNNFAPSVFCNEFGWSNEFELENRRLIVTYTTARAKKDKADRERLIERLEKKRDKSGEINADKLITNSGTKKFTTRISEKIKLNFAKIEEDSKCTSISL
jgi:hypothetical protein